MYTHLIHRENAFPYMGCATIYSLAGTVMSRLLDDPADVIHSHTVGMPSHTWGVPESREVIPRYRGIPRSWNAQISISGYATIFGNSPISGYPTSRPPPPCRSSSSRSSSSSKSRSRNSSSHSTKSKCKSKSSSSSSKSRSKSRSKGSQRVSCISKSFLKLAHPASHDGRVVISRYKTLWNTVNANVDAWALLANLASVPFNVSSQYV